MTFADSQMSATLQRIKEEADESGFFDEVLALDENAFEPSFQEKYGKWIEEHKRGYGYWIWKPYLIRKTLDELDKGDYLVYLDAGCEINKEGRQRFNQYIKKVTVSELGILAFDTGLPDAEYAKGDLIDFLDMMNSPQIHTGQIMGGIVVLCKKETSVSFVNDWEKKVLNNLDMIDDSISKMPNFNGFKENRHDQAVLSLLFKKNGGGVVLPNHEVDIFPPTNQNWRRLKHTPFHAIRNRSGKSRLGNKTVVELVVANACWDMMNTIQDFISKLRVFIGGLKKKKNNRPALS